MEEPPDPLIQACPHCQVLIDVSDQEPLAVIFCPSCGGPSEVAGHIDHFNLLEVLGEGGMGVVYKALDTSLERLVALKLLRKSSTASPDQIAQLAHEAALTASINHPHVVKVYSTGMDAGRFYIAMELVQQGTLDQRITQDSKIPEAQALQIGIQIAQGLRAAHQAGLIHRDVKPGNILFDNLQIAKIVDFGLATTTEEGELSPSEIWGTPYYLAPEKLDHKPEDFRSDIYSLGATLFHALAGRPPFEDKTASLVAVKHLKTQAVSLQAFAPWISGATAFAINRTLKKDPEQRYQSYDELIEHLQYALSELSTPKPQISKRVVLETPAQNQVAFWFSILLILIFIGAASSIYFFRDSIFKKTVVFAPIPQKSPKTKLPIPPSSPANSPANPNNPLIAPPATPAPEKPLSIAPDALAKLRASNFTEASLAFHQAASQPSLSNEQRLWAALLEGLSESAAGHAVLANDAFNNILALPTTATDSIDLPLSAFLLKIAKLSAGNNPIPPPSIAPFDPANYQSILPLFAAIKNWQLTRPEDAIVLFEQFLATNPTGRNSWIADLKPLATPFIDQFKAYQKASAQLKAAQSPTEKIAAIDSLKKITGKLAPRAKNEIAKSQADSPSP